jgi:hypothetical protein
MAGTKEKYKKKRPNFNRLRASPDKIDIAAIIAMTRFSECMGFLVSQLCG